MTPTTHDGDHGRTGTGGEDGPDRAGERAAAGRARSTRRRVLAALGAASLPAVAGCAGGSTAGAGPGTTAAGAATGESTTREREPAATGTGTGTAGGNAVDPRFGFVGARDESPPVDPDHTVRLEIRPRENGPIPEFYFEPTGLAVEVGDTVRFGLATPHHNVNAYHPAFGFAQRVPDGTPAYSSPVLGGGERARSPELTAGRVLSDPALRPGRVADRGSVSWTEIAEENKRPLLRPVEA
jgi:hypothetical protein